MSISAVALLALLIQTPAKLEIKEVSAGTGRAAQAGDVLTVEYTGALKDGKQFDSSKGRQPFSFVLGSGQVIKGWDEGLLGMKAGGKRRLTIPPEMGYGAQTQEGIPANSTLIFDIELLKIDRAGNPQKVEITTLGPGKGEPAQNGDEIVLNWKGRFINGKEFVNTYTSKQPAQMTVGSLRVPKGITEAIQGIKVGEKRRATIPYSLGYGAQGAGGIPPYATLVIEVEAVAITPKAQALERDKKMLKIEEQTVGTGAEAKEGDTVEIHYTGSFPDGKKFDSSRDRNKTFSFKLGQGSVIRGFDLGVMGMKVGGKRKITIPPELGYGVRGAGGAIPPNATLVFELELISIK